MNKSKPARDRIGELADLLEARRAGVGALETVMGFDGFLDQVMRVVGERRGPGQFAPVPDIAAFSEWIGSCAGRSGLREVVLEEAAPGGCTMNMGDGLATLGVPVDCFAVLGTPPDAAFGPWLAKMRSVHPLDSAPGYSSIFEFDDGKLIFCRLSHFERIHRGFMAERFPKEAYLAACQRAKVVGLTSWSVFPFMNECWEWLLENVYGAVGHRPWFYVDLADPASRSGEDRLAMLALLGRFEKHGPVSLNLNLNEANHLARTTGLPAAGEEEAEVMALAEGLRRRVGIAEVGIHRVKAATVASEREGAHTQPGPFCARPRKSTGAGDRFNAGYCLGLQLGLEPAARLLLGGAVSGYYVRHAASAGMDDLIGFLRRWAAGALESGGP